MTLNLDLACYIAYFVSYIQRPRPLSLRRQSSSAISLSLNLVDSSAALNFAVQAATRGCGASSRVAVWLSAALQSLALKPPSPPLRLPR
jgi:hypothetical protein